MQGTQLISIRGGAANCGSFAPSWYAVYTKTGDEDGVAANLARAEIKTFSPKIKSVRFIKRKYREVLRPLFPSYIFARFDALRFYHLVKYTRGVRGIVGGSAEPWPVGDEIIQAIESKVGPEGALEVPSAMSPGAHVLVADGPLKGLCGVFEREMSDRERVIVLLDAIEYQARVEIEKRFLIKRDS